MEQNVLTTVVLPIALGVIMLGLGLTLGLADFTRVFKAPRAVLVGLVCQMLILPAAAYGVARALALPPALAVGLMLLAASPGGASANLFSHLAKGDVALNITLTAVNSLLSLFTLPLLVNASIAAFINDGRVIGLQTGKVLEVFAIVLVPVTLGMLIRWRKPAAAAAMDKPVRIMSAVFLLLVVVGAIAKERAHLTDYFAQVGLAALAFNLISLGTGYLVPRLAKVEARQSVAVGMEIGIHNGTLAILIASSPRLLNDTTIAIPAAVYSVIMFFTAAAFGMAMARRKGTAEQPLPLPKMTPTAG
ncbi:MAG: bile acid:sodium symporter family protein [Myxococcaceae bacterium]